MLCFRQVILSFCKEYLWRTDRSKIQYFNTAGSHENAFWHSTKRSVRLTFSTFLFPSGSALKLRQVWDHTVHIRFKHAMCAMCISSLFNGAAYWPRELARTLLCADCTACAAVPLLKSGTPELSGVRLSDVIVGEKCSKHWLVCQRISALSYVSASLPAQEAVYGGRVGMMEPSCYDLWQSGHIIEDHHLSGSALPTMKHHLHDTKGQRISSFYSRNISIFFSLSSTSQQPHFFVTLSVSVRNAVGHSAGVASWQADTPSATIWIRDAISSDYTGWFFLLFFLLCL